MKKLVICVALMMTVLFGNSVMTKEDCPKTVPFEVANGNYVDFHFISREDDGAMNYTATDTFNGHRVNVTDYTVRYL